MTASALDNGSRGVEADLWLALRLADLADGLSMSVFTGGPLPYETKVDGSPVTAADETVEAALRVAIERHRPGDGFLGEEGGGWWGASRRWIIDAIDGTANFAAGSPAWGTLIALEDNGNVTVGVAASPAMGTRCWAAHGLGAWAQDDRMERRRLEVSAVTDLADAKVVVHPNASRQTGWASAVSASLASRSNVVPLIDHPGLMVAKGVADAALLLGGAPWGHAAPVVIVQEAGGAFSDHFGTQRIDLGGAVFSNTALHAQLLQLCETAAGEAS